MYLGFYLLYRISHEQSSTLWTPLQMDMPSEDDLLPTEHYLWDNDRNGSFKLVKRYPVTIPASVRVGAFQRSCQAAILLGYATNWEAANAEIEEPPSVYSFVQLESATRNLIEALITRSETWSENLNTYALCARPDTPARDPETDMEMKKAVAGIKFTIGLVIDGSNGIFNAYANREDVLEHCAPVWPYAQYHTMQLLFHYEALLEDAESMMAEVRQSVESTTKRWACSRKDPPYAFSTTNPLTPCFRLAVGRIRQSPGDAEERGQDVQKGLTMIGAPLEAGRADTAQFLNET
ncbi:uncharacterized protein ColSpa_09264 [Colletotrichum spaethianum]|uniref:Uncharacterized protein n=1 Tax=Colletotrichum spaethianum TaxID=700344 RepID=A0AA37US06_9PEZI|nr:uncharacterized protein ColSpa_09264 [Colletotrichum spaethianum]GKT49083.1 hypothetical protein ColSpa_09264 [Colletotrichum spaethianum]